MKTGSCQMTNGRKLALRLCEFSIRKVLPLVIRLRALLGCEAWGFLGLAILSQILATKTTYKFHPCNMLRHGPLTC